VKSIFLILVTAFLSLSSSAYVSDNSFPLMNLVRGTRMAGEGASRMFTVLSQVSGVESVTQSDPQRPNIDLIKLTLRNDGGSFSCLKTIDRTSSSHSEAFECGIEQ
jgi:hypothetical protein